MKGLLTTLLLLPALASAQNYPGMNEADMQNMMQHMQKAQACMQNVDQGAMRQLQHSAEEMEAKVDELCKAGKRDQAQSEAMDFYTEISADPEVKKMQACGKMMRGAMPNMAAMTGMPNVPADIDEPGKDSHICDN